MLSGREGGDRIDLLMVEPRGSQTPVLMTAFGASRPLPYVPAEVSFLITQRAFSRHSGNWSSCPICVIRRPLHVRLR